MLLVTDHPLISNENFTTSIVAWWDGGLHFFTKPPAGVEATPILSWYYFAYFLVFLCGFILARRWVAKGSLNIKKRDVTDLGIYCLLGVMLGAKIVYVLFYNLEYYLKNPADIFLNWSGMASHGAFIGVAIAIVLFARRFKAKTLEVFDHAAIVAALGPIFIRAANFLNGELYGRSTSEDNPLAMRFPMRDGEGRELFAKVQPSSPDHASLVQGQKGAAGEELFARVEFQSGERLEPEDWYYEKVDAHHGWELVDSESYLAGAVFGRVNKKQADGGNEIILVHRVVTDPSHPSQLYQLGVSGILLLIVLLIVRARSKATGVVFATFLIFYGCSRIAMEFFRQPDHQRSGGLFEYVTMGQLLSLVVIAAGLWVLRMAKRNKPHDEEPDSPAEEAPQEAFLSQSEPEA